MKTLGLVFLILAALALALGRITRNPRSVFWSSRRRWRRRD